MAHEIGNPITGIDCLAQEMKLLSNDNDIRQVSGQILEQTKRVSQIVQTLVSYAHSGQNHQQRRGNKEVVTPEPVDLHASIQEAISLLQLSHKNSQIEFRNLCQQNHQVSG